MIKTRKVKKLLKMKRIKLGLFFSFKKPLFWTGGKEASSRHHHVSGYGQRGAHHTHSNPNPSNAAWSFSQNLRNALVNRLAVSHCLFTYTNLPIASHMLNLNYALLLSSTADCWFRPRKTASWLSGTERAQTRYYLPCLPQSCYYL